MTYGCINSIKISVAAPSDKEKKGGKRRVENNQCFSWRWNAELQQQLKEPQQQQKPCTTAQRFLVIINTQSEEGI